MDADDILQIRQRLEEIAKVQATLIDEFRSFRELYLSSRRDLWEKSRERWRGDEPDTSLTWGAVWTGDAFIEQVQNWYAFRSESTILEIGPGYGRILDTLLQRGLPFASYLGVDISANRVQRLREKYTNDPRVRFMEADAETFNANVGFDLCLSSATFSHLYPNFDVAKANIRRHLIISGVLCFDVSEGDSRGGFQDDGKTYGRVYSEGEVRDVFSAGRSNFNFLGISRIYHGLDGVTGRPVQMLFIAVRRAR